MGERRNLGMERDAGPLRKRLLGLASAAGTCCMIATVLLVSHFLLAGAASEVAAALWMVAYCSGGAAAAACLLCHLVDPGAPTADPDDAPPADEHNDAERIRKCKLPDGHTWDQKWCRDCKLWRPHRCGHCHMCDRCVLRLDHHCGFMGTCVGERNCRFFAAFLFFAGVGIICLAALAVDRLTSLGCWRSGSAWFQAWQPLVIVVLCSCCCPLPWPCLGLTLTGAGLGQSAMMLADTDVHNFDHSAAGSREAMAECTNCMKCRGFCVYCCVKVSCKPWPRRDSSRVVCAEAAQPVP
mmetsp:Transcript_107622/g.303078  ORF Transcript_107622/g.303078 Transcript_107622/m.303078 type:complete len:296 (-) Transcript_107622:40-927(-)